MGRFLKVFSGFVLLGLGFFLIFFRAHFALLLGLGGVAGFIVQLIVSVALIAGGITLIVKVRR